jgi:hypothetical protein
MVNCYSICYLIGWVNCYEIAKIFLVTIELGVKRECNVMVTCCIVIEMLIIKLLFSWGETVRIAKLQGIKM